jgi:hypothetical protein
MSELNPETSTPELAETPAVPPAPQKKATASPLSFKVSAKGAVSVYGLDRFPVTLYYEQWKRLLQPRTTAGVPRREQELVEE